MPCPYGEPRRRDFGDKRLKDLRYGPGAFHKGKKFCANGSAR